MTSNDKPPSRKTTKDNAVTASSYMCSSQDDQKNSRRAENSPHDGQDLLSKRSSEVFRRRSDYSDPEKLGLLGQPVRSHQRGPSQNYSRPSHHAGSHSSSDQERHHLEHPYPRYVASAPSSDSATVYSYHPYPHHHHLLPMPPYGMVPSAPQSSSFESHVRSPTAMMPPAAYSYPPPGYPYYQWTPAAPIEYITNIKPSDVLSGRGGATNSHSGNRGFRSLVKRYQGQYLKAKKRDKPAVASIIVDKIREKSGRFLRRIDTTPQGQVLWVDIGDDRAREKTCQALREGAPELRRKRRATSADEEDTKRSVYKEHSASSSIDPSASVDEDNSGHTMAKRTPIVRATMDHENPGFIQNFDFPKDEPLMIRPSAALTRRRCFEAISVDQLDPAERELYLRDFLPPNPAIRRKTTKNLILRASTNADEPSRKDENNYTWPVVKV